MSDNSLLTLNPDYEFLELRHLEKLPIPSLEHTCKKFIKTASCLAENREEIQDLKRDVNEFLNNEGRLLHSELLQLNHVTKTSYLEGFWNTMYRELQCPVVFHVSPFGLYMKDPKRVTMISRAASLINAAALFRNKILQKDVKGFVGMVKNMELCLTQYQWIQSTRIPDSTRDYSIKTGHSRYVVVLYRNRLCKIDIVDEKGIPIPEVQHTATLDAFVKYTKKMPFNQNVSILTTEDRPVWANARAHLISHSEENAETISIIENALLCFGLDDRRVKNLSHFSAIMCHGYDGRSRWYDKSINIIVLKDGNAGEIMEHSSFDGDTMHAWANFCVNEFIGKPVPTKNQVSKFKPKYTLLSWELDNTDILNIKKAESKLIGTANSIHIESVTFDDFGKDIIKSQLEISPNAFIQMAVQYTFFRMYLKPGSTYEALNMKSYYHGRTATARTVSAESIEFTKSMLNPLDSLKEKHNKLKEAAKCHQKTCREARKGYGIDRHLYALQQLAVLKKKRLSGYEIPSIFTNPLYPRMKTDKLSTSNMSGTNAVVLGGFGPTSDAGFGVGYVMDSKSIVFCVSSWTNRSDLFIRLLVRSLREMRTVLQKKVMAKL